MVGRIFVLNIVIENMGAGRGRALATFDADIGGLRILGCAIIRAPEDGRLLVLGPQSRLLGSDRKIVWFSDLDLKAKFDQRAIAAYRAMTHDEAGGSVNVAKKRPAVDDYSAVRRVVGADVSEVLERAGL